MGRKKDKVLQYIDIEASEAESSELSEDLGPSGDLEWEDMGSIKDLPSSESVKEEEEEEEEEEYERPAVSLLPNMFSPKLFLIKVPMGKEIAYVNRISCLENILTVIYKEELKGYIYVECVNKRVLQERINSRNITLIPINEMTDIFSENIVFNKYGRIRSGKYKGDTCEILEIINNEILKIKLIPRIENVKQLFNPSNFNCVKAQGYFVYKKDCYKNGFLEKEVLARNIIPVTKINFEDLEIFEPKKIVKNGERVCVTSGEFKNEKGRVIKTELTGAYLVLDNYGKQFLEYNSLQIIKENELDFSVFKRENEMKKPERRFYKRDPLVNKEVTIRKGEFKGYKGIIKDSYREQVRVLINSNLKDVNLNREDVIVEEAIYNVDYDLNKTPSHKTPAYKTPGYKTPGYKTPGYKTPGNEIKNTPGYKTPGYKTPSWKIPSYYTSTLRKGGELTEGIFKNVLISADNTIKEVLDSNANEFICIDGTYLKSNISYVKPEKYDCVCVMDGDDKGKQGILVAITEEECVVRIEDKPMPYKLYEISKVKKVL